MKKVFVLVAPLLTIACLFGSSRLTRMETPVASVDGKIITARDLDTLIQTWQRRSGSAVPVDSLKFTALDTMINFQLEQIRIDSIKTSLDQNWDYVQKRLDDNQQYLYKVIFDRQITSRIVIDSAKVAKYYNEHLDGYKDPEKIKARHILIKKPKPDTAGVKSEDKRKKLISEAEGFARKRAEAVYKRAQSGENWDSLVTAFSEDKATMTKGGDLGEISRGKMGSVFDSAAFIGTAPAIVGPVSTRLGYHVIRIDEFKPARQKPLDMDVENSIHGDIIREEERTYADVYLDSLKKATTVTYNEEVMALPDSLVNPRTWIVLMNSVDTVHQRTINENLPRYMRWKHKAIDSLTVEDKKDMIDKLMPSFLLSSSARANGYFNHPEYVKACDEYTMAEAKLRYSGIVEDKEYQPSDSELAVYYNNNLNKYKIERKLHVHHIIFQDSALAVVIRDSILAGSDFVEIAKRYYPGEPEIREVAYNLDFIGPDDMGQAFYQAVDTLQKGQVSMPVKTGWGYHLVKLVNRKNDIALEQARPGIRQALKDARNSARKNAIIAEWKEGSDVVIFEKALKKYKPAEKKVIQVEPEFSKKAGS